MLLLLCGAISARAERARPICSDRSSAAPVIRGGGAIQILGWEATVCLEHSDRVTRLQRLAEMLPTDERPIFRQYLLAPGELGGAFPSDMPLLRVVFPERSFFDTASSRIRPEAASALALIAASLRHEIPDVAVFIAGHTDPRGEEDYNYNLSVERADSVARRLAEIGVGGVALWRVGFGEAVPLQPNDSQAGMALNRRVEFIIGARTEAVATWLSRQTPNFCAGRSEAVGSCTKPLKRREFEAVAVTARTGFVAAAKGRAPTAAPTPASRRQRPLLAAATRQVAAPVPRRARLVLQLNTQKYRIPAPER